MRFFLVVILWILAGAAYATPPLPEQLLAFFQQQDPPYAKQMTLGVITAKQYWPDCPAPTLGVAPNSRRWGRVTVVTQCGKRQFLLQILLRVTGHYFVSRQTVRQGSTLTAAMVTRCQGRLDHLPVGAWLTLPALPLIALQTVRPGQILTNNQFRLPWLIQQGQSIFVRMVGVGFQITTRAIALDHGSLGKTIRVKTANGQRFTAKVAGQNDAIVE